MDLMGIAAIIGGAIALLTLANNRGRSHLAWAVLVVCVGIVLVELGFDNTIIPLRK